MVAGFCVNCPESADTAMEDLREIGPTFSFAPPRVFEKLLTRVMVRMEDAGRAQAAACSTTSSASRGAAARRSSTGEPVPLKGRLLYALGELLRLRAAEERARLLAHPRRLHGGRGDRAGDVPLLSLARHEPEAALRPDRSVPSTSPRSRTARSAPTRSGRPAPNVEIRIAENGEVLFKSPGMFLGYYKDPRPRPPRPRRRTAACKTGDAGFFDAKTGHLKIIDRAKDVGQLNDGTLFAPKYIENKLKFYPNIKEAVAFGDGRDFVTVMLNIDLDRGRQLGRAQQRRLRAPTRSSPAIRSSTT